QREGGGNNYFDKEMTQKLNNMTPSELKAHVLMERIRPRNHPAWLMVQGQSDYTSCVSEIGRYGVLLANRGTIELNSDCGYLVRTKSEDVNEGGVCAGYSCLNTLCLEEKRVP
ncbi:MAG: glutathione synthase, partial [bacterium]